VTIFINYLTQLPGLVLLGLVLLMFGGAVFAVIDSISEDIRKSKEHK
jgi:hypothetical protein